MKSNWLREKRCSLRTSKVLCAVLLLALLTGCSISTTAEKEYAEAIFGVDIISLEIIADSDAWQTMLDTAEDETYIMVDVVVNGTRFNDVGIRAKGNSSLKQVASSDSDRYSFRLKFDEYIEGQTCFGLDSFVVNNMSGDNTYMKEYLSYDLMKTIGVNVPYFGYTNITVNDEPWGLYLAVELYNDSYEQRVFETTTGMLYNVKMADMNVREPLSGEQSEPSTGEQSEPLSGEQHSPSKGGIPDGMPGGLGAMPDGKGAMPGGFGAMPGGLGAGDSGGSLTYIDDETSSYSSIFENVVGDGEEADFQRVITALDALSTGSDLETYFDVDAILRYFAAHNIVVNLDSYSSSMAQNYYLYEHEGQITILPWDYNLAWGGFQSSDASSVVNFPIDSPVSGIEMSDRPLLDQLLSNEAYLEKYHGYVQELLEVYFANGRFEAKVQDLNALISDYVKKDATAFCTFEVYEKAVTSLIKLGNLRYLSVQGQLDGTVPSTTADQKTRADELIPIDGLNLIDLGTMMGRGQPFNR